MIKISMLLFNQSKNHTPANKLMHHANAESQNANKSLVRLAKAQDEQFADTPAANMHYYDYSNSISKMYFAIMASKHAHCCVFISESFLH